MTLVIPIEEVKEQDRPVVGGKAYALSQLLALGMEIPPALCITTEAYTRYTSLTGLRERIPLELNRKRFEEMRWEEMWDASLRIRNMFLRTPIPPEIGDPICSALKDCSENHAFVVRSSAPEEDSAKTSFAGIHESYINIRGMERILTHIRLVWASLWSDAALLYRKELGLHFKRSRMAVLVQEMIVGARSGVIFGMNPNDSNQAVIEAVYGLNAGLVDGTIEPDRWILERNTGRLIDHMEPDRNALIVPAEEGTRLESLPEHLRRTSPLDETECGALYQLVRKAEDRFKSPQDMEWTFRDRSLRVLQSRPITTTGKEMSEDQRPWYLSLRRSLDNLKELRQKIENRLIPEMIQEAYCLKDQDLGRLSDIELAEEIRRRKSRYQYWIDVYWEDFIPFAHGMRLFGQAYNDTVKPIDPFEFMKLLRANSLLSVERNRNLQTMARTIRQDPRLENYLKGAPSADPEFGALLDLFIEKIGVSEPPMQNMAHASFDRDAIIPFIMEMAESATMDKEKTEANIEALTAHFISCFGDARKETALALLDLGRASYQLRDDDNIYLGRIKNLMTEAFDAAKDRIEKRRRAAGNAQEPKVLIEMLKDSEQDSREADTAGYKKIPPSVRARQLVGQPAGPGISRGIARVIARQADLFEFKQGEILVCDALDPTMTFIVPLSSGIVERRGGMLIHGAIIAREYGIPCVTGVAQATEFIQTGRTLTVDGYLGIVTVE